MRRHATHSIALSSSLRYPLETKVGFLSNAGTLNCYIWKCTWLRARKTVPDFQQAWRCLLSWTSPAQQKQLMFCSISMGTICSWQWEKGAAVAMVEEVEGREVARRQAAGDVSSMPPHAPCPQIYGRATTNPDPPPLLGVRGRHGALCCRPAAPAQRCHLPAEEGKHAVGTGAQPRARLIMPLCHHEASLFKECRTFDKCVDIKIITVDIKGTREVILNIVMTVVKFYLVRNCKVWLTNPLHHHLSVTVQ